MLRPGKPYSLARHAAFSPALAALAALLLARAARAQLPPPDPDDGGLELPPGFRAVVVADELRARFQGDAVRFIAVAPDGDIYGKLYAEGLFAVRVDPASGRMTELERFGSGPGTAVAWHGPWLYYSTRTGLYRYRMTPGELVPRGRPETVISGLPAGIQHDAKSFAFDEDGNVLVEIGAPYNAYSQNDRQPGAKGMDATGILRTQGGFWRFPAGRLNQTEADGFHYATGERQSLALAWNPVSKAYFNVMMGRDNLNRVDPKDYSAYDNSVRVSEEMHRLRPGANLGWPYTYYDPLKHARMMAPEFGGDNRLRPPPGKYDDPVIAFPAHWAPEQMAFYFGRQFPAKYRGGAFVAFHGSYDRTPLPQAGFKVVFIPFDAAGNPTGRFEVFADGFTGTRAPLASETLARFRPGGIAVGPDGSLYVSDTKRGRIWRILYTGRSRPGAVAVNPVPPDDSIVPPPVLSAATARSPGERLYAQACAGCHMVDGSGVSGMQPPLAGDPVVAGDPARLIAVVLRGPAAVLPPGRPRYANAMPPFASYADQDLAALLTYVRSRFGSGASGVASSEIKAARSGSSGSARPSASSGADPR